MPTLLLVDDDKNFLLSFMEGLIAYDETFLIHTARNGKAAIKILESKKIDLVISDLKMPKMDGFELLAYMSRHYPKIPVFIITAFGTPEIEKSISNLGAFQYLEKPLDFDVMVARIYDGLDSVSSGYIKGTSLPSFLQLVQLEKKTFTLVISFGKSAGFLYFKNGELIDAETASKQGVEAALEIIGWDPVEIEIESRTTNRVQIISADLNFLILESQRRKDELNKDSQLIKKTSPEPTPDLEICYKEPVEAELNMDAKEFQDTLHMEKEKAPVIPFSEPVKEEHAFVTEIGDAQNKVNIIKENNMNVKKLNEAIESLKENVGPGLLTTDIYGTNDGQTIAGYNSNPKAAALFTQITNYLTRSLKESGFPELGRYYIVDLTQNQIVVIVTMGDYQWGMLVDSLKSPLGLLLNVAIPRVVSAFEEAMIG